VRHNTVLQSGARSDILEAHRVAIASLSLPGVRWTSTELIAIATEQRRALDHRDLSPWDAPSTIAGVIADDHLLAPTVVDVVWRLTNHSGTLSDDWYEATVSQLPTAEHYVELLGIVAIMSAMDRSGAGFHTAARARVRTTKRGSRGGGDGLDTLGSDGPRRRFGRVRCSHRYTRRRQDAALAQRRPVHEGRAGARRLRLRPRVAGAKPDVAARTARGNECFYCTTGHAMLLGLSGGLGTGETIDPSMFVTGAGVPHGGLIARFVDAATADNDDLPAARDQLAIAVGPEALIEVAAVMGAVHMTNRLTNGTGTPLESHYIDASAALRSDLGLDELPTKRLGKIGRRPAPSELLDGSVMLSLGRHEEPDKEVDAGIAHLGLSLVHQLSRLGPVLEPADSGPGCGGVVAQPEGGSLVVATDVLHNPSGDTREPGLFPRGAFGDANQGFHRRRYSVGVDGAAGSDPVTELGDSSVEGRPQSSRLVNSGMGIAVVTGWQRA